MYQAKLAEFKRKNKCVDKPVTEMVKDPGTLGGTGTGGGLAGLLAEPELDLWDLLKGDPDAVDEDYDPVVVGDGPGLAGMFGLTG